MKKKRQRPSETHPDTRDEIGKTEWWRNGWLWLTVTLVVVLTAIALSWVHWITVNDQWVTIKQHFQRVGE